MLVLVPHGSAVNHVVKSRVVQQSVELEQSSLQNVGKAFEVVGGNVAKTSLLVLGDNLGLEGHPRCERMEYHKALSIHS